MQRQKLAFRILLSDKPVSSKQYHLLIQLPIWKDQLGWSG
jgi:hypothetical protein